MTDILAMVLRYAMHALSSGSSPGNVRGKNWASVWPVPGEARLEVGVLRGREVADGDWWEVGDLSNTSFIVDRCFHWLE